MKPTPTTLPLDLGTMFPKDAYSYGERTSGETHGVVLTKPHVVNLILDMAGYRATRNLTKRVLLEPSSGEGAFLVEAVRRLAASRRRYKVAWDSLGGAIRAFDIDEDHVERSQAAVVETLLTSGAGKATAHELARDWVRTADFLLTPAAGDADYVVGNPPYIRIEHLAPELQAVYRRRFVSLYDRADLYVAFIEHGLAQLSRRGTLSYICADRWTLNKYGKKLRKVIQDRYKVNAYVDLHQASPFESEVIAYPAIFSIGRENDGPVRVVKMADASPEECRSIGKALLAKKAPSVVHEYDTWFPGSAPWVISSPTHLKTLRWLEERYPALEDEGGTRVGIGVATGIDRVYVVDHSLDVEPDRLVPLVMRADIENGAIQDSKRAVINTFVTGGGTIDLDRFPRLAKYFEGQSELIRKRHVAKKNPTSWFRTIDRVYPELVETPKLLIPDIAGSIQVAHDPGRFHPHHNLYYIVSDDWDLEVLGGLLSSRVSLFFVWSYAVRMRGGYLRFQAQYLRRIRVPSPAVVSKSLSARLRDGFRRRDFAALDELALTAYGLDELPEFDFVDTRT